MTLSTVMERRRSRLKSSSEILLLFHALIKLFAGVRSLHFVSLAFTSSSVARRPSFCGALQQDLVVDQLAENVQASG